MFSPDHASSPLLHEFCRVAVPGFGAAIVAAVAAAPVRAFVRSENGPRPGAAVTLSPIARARRGVQPFTVTP